MDRSGQSVCVPEEEEEEADKEIGNFVEEMEKKLWLMKRRAVQKVTISAAAAVQSLQSLR